MRVLGPLIASAVWAFLLVQGMAIYRDVVLLHVPSHPTIVQLSILVLLPLLMLVANLIWVIFSKRISSCLFFSTIPLQVIIVWFMFFLVSGGI
jgi:hypothetical protein